MYLPEAVAQVEGFHWRKFDLHCLSKEKGLIKQNSGPDPSVLALVFKLCLILSRQQNKKSVCN